MNFQPGLQPNSEQKADEMHVSPAIAKKFNHQRKFRLLLQLRCRRLAFFGNRQAAHYGNPFPGAADHRSNLAAKATQHSLFDNSHSSDFNRYEK